MQNSLKSTECRRKNHFFQFVTNTSIWSNTAPGPGIYQAPLHSFRENHLIFNCLCIQESRKEVIIIVFMESIIRSPWKQANEVATSYGSVARLKKSEKIAQKWLLQKNYDTYMSLIAHNRFFSTIALHLVPFNVTS